MDDRPAGQYNLLSVMYKGSYYPVVTIIGRSEGKGLFVALQLPLGVVHFGLIASRLHHYPAYADQMTQSVDNANLYLE